MKETNAGDLNTKAARTRAHILDTALHLFAERGYEPTTMREIAAVAGCSLGLTYRYFSRKEDLVLALYTRLETEFAADVAQLLPGPLAVRFPAAMQAKLARIAPYRDSFAALFGAALNPASGVSVIGDSTTEIRDQVIAVFDALVVGSSDAPPPPLAGRLATVLYGLHLALLFVSFTDRSPDGRTTTELLAFAGEALGLTGALLALPAAGMALTRLAGVISPALGVPVPQPTIPNPPSEEIY